MKKTLSFLISVALCTSMAFAQDTQMFNHLAIGGSIDFSTGNMGINFSMPIGPHFQARLGYQSATPGIAMVSAIASSPKLLGQKLQPMDVTIKDINYHQNGVNIDEVHLTGAWHSRSIDLLFDYYPKKKGVFHLTAGAYFNLHPSIIHIDGEPKSNNGPVFVDASDKGHTSIYGITTDYDGMLHADLAFKLNVVKPYIGLGWGRNVRTSGSIVSVNFDMGLLFIGGIQLCSYNYQSGKAEKVILNTAWADKYPEIKDKLNEAQVRGITAYKVLDVMGKFPVAGVLRLNLNFRLF